MDSYRTVQHRLRAKADTTREPATAARPALVVANAAAALLCFAGIAGIAGIAGMAIAGLPPAAKDDPVHAGRVSVGLCGAGGLGGGWEVLLEDPADGEVVAPEQVTGKEMRLVGPRRLERRLARYRAGGLAQARTE